MTKLAKGGAAVLGGLKTADRITGVGSQSFGPKEWVEVSEFERILSKEPRPAKVTYWTANAKGGSDYSADLAWETILAFIKSNPTAAKGIGELFTEYDDDGNGKVYSLHWPRRATANELTPFILVL